jgi:uncharacterized protein (UPF0333 family)
MRYLILTAVLVLTGCITAPVVPLDEGNYLASVHTMFGLTSPRALNAKAADEADEYCAQTGRTAHIKNRLSTGVVGLTNLSGNVVFSCVTTRDGDYIPATVAGGN